ncbi:MAG TPA: hypothetical protein PLR99_27840, partial [Polyangiaceae bacterium]|nr:hypothetical protein [Polyangiaceae bacterium]
MSQPGELGAYDPAFVAAHAPWLRRALFRYFRADVSGLEHLPEGPFVAVGNHSGATLIPDTLVWLAAYHTAGRATPLLTLAHDQLFRAYPAALARALARLAAVARNRPFWIVLGSYTLGGIALQETGDLPSAR